jgi:hypothetical protein
MPNWRVKSENSSPLLGSGLSEEASDLSERVLGSGERITGEEETILEEDSIPQCGVDVLLFYQSKVKR